MSVLNICVDGHDYSYTVEGDCVSVRDRAGDLVAEGVADSTFETFSYSYYSAEGDTVEQIDDGENTDLYYNEEWEDRVEWLISTHPDFS
jgi:hypothetical protein